MSAPIQFGKSGFKLQAFGASAAESGEQPDRAPVQARQSDGAHRRILLVEDDQRVREVLLEILEGHSYVVTTAENGREALEALRRGLATDLIIWTS